MRRVGRCIDVLHARGSARSVVPIPAPTIRIPGTLALPFTFAFTSLLLSVLPQTFSFPSLPFLPQYSLALYFVDHVFVFFLGVAVVEDAEGVEWVSVEVASITPGRVA